MTDKQRLEEIKERCYKALIISGRATGKMSPLIYDCFTLIDWVETAWLEIERMRNEVSVPNGDFPERKRGGSTYENVRKELESWPDWKKKAYNDNFATSAHAKKLNVREDTNKRLEEIKARCEAATKGPWDYDGMHPEINAPDEWGMIISMLRMHPGDEILDDFGHAFNPDFEFIANARDDIPWLLTQLAEREREIERMQEAQRWIPVTERLPEETECGTDVLVAIKYGDELDSDKTITCCGYLLDGEWWTYREHDCGRVGSKPLNKGDKVVYWMPLPAPPEKGE